MHLAKRWEALALASTGRCLWPRRSMIAFACWFAVAAGGVTRAATWEGTDIGSPPTVGSETVVGDTVTVTASGGGIGSIFTQHVSQGRGDDPYQLVGTGDSFHFTWLTLSGDAQIVAHLSSISGAAAAQAGLMIRSSTDQGSNNIATYVTSDGGLFSSWRGDPYIWPYVTNFSVFQQTGGGAGVWLKLIRANGGVMSYTSVDGVTWTPLSWHTIDLGGSVEVGLLVANPKQTDNATVVFDHVSVGAPAPAMAPPPAAANFAVTQSGLDYATFTWTPPTGAFERVALERSSDGANFTAVQSWRTLKSTDTTPGTTTDNTCAPATTYTYRVATICGTAATYSPTMIVTTPPLTLSAGSVWASRINLTWDCAAAPLKAFSIEYSTDNKVWKFASAGADLRATPIDALWPNTTYYVRIAGAEPYTTGAAGYSNVVTATTNSTPPPGSPPPPGNLRVLSASGADVVLGWDDNSTDETGFILEASSDGTNWGAPYGAIEAWKPIVANQTTYETYNPSFYTGPGYFRVRSINTNGASDFSPVLTVVTPWVESPTTLVAAAVSASEIDLTWADNSNNEGGFQIQQMRADGTWATIGSVPANTTSYNVTSLAAGTKYSFAVAAVAPNGTKSSGITSATATTLGGAAGGSPPDVEGATGPAPGFYGPNSTLTFTLTFSAPVNVTGTPFFRLSIGGEQAQATYASGSGSTVLRFKYVTAVGDNGQLVINGPVSVGTGTIRGLDGSDANVLAGYPLISGVVLDTTPPNAPVLTSVGQGSTPSFSGTAEPGATVEIHEAPGGGNRFAGSATAATDRTWTINWSGPGMPPGTYSFQAFATDRAGNRSALTAPFTVTVPSDNPPPSTNPPPADNPPPPSASSDQTITFASPVSAIIVGQPITLGAQSGAGLPITYTVVSGDATISGNVLTPKSTADLVVRAASAGDATHNAASVDVDFGSPQKAAQQISVVMTAGTVPAEKPVALTATSSSGLPVTYTVVSGPATLSGATLTFTGTGTVVVKATQPGDGTYAAANDQTLTFTASPADRLVNLSSRLRVSGSDAAHASIAGFVVTGDAPKQILVRAVGPSLATYGISSPLPDPELKLFDAKGVPVATNAGWADDPAIAAAGDAVGAFKLAAGSRDAALLVTLAPGLYTAQVDSTHSGTALIEVYDATANAAVPTKQLINISTRGYVGTGDDVLVAGFVVAGDAPKRVLIRGVGPTLGSFGVSGTLTDPMLTVYDAKQNVVARNDNWGTPQVLDPTQTASSAADIEAADTASGAFALQSGSSDAAVILTLPPGQYSAIVTGANGATGAAMVEVYELADASK